MRAAFSRASLLVHANTEGQLSDSTALSPNRSSTTRGRVLFHEAVHYWQQLSQGFLVKLADEEWARLRTYEAKGEMAGTGPVRREFERRDPRVGCSARDLHECLARYWEIIAFGPAQVIRHEWQTDREAAHPDFQQAWKRMRHSLGAPETASSFTDVFMAMLMIGGEYAAPFIDSCQRFGDAAAFIFPCLAHLALTTDQPTTSYATLADECGQRLVDDASRTIDNSSLPLTERYDSVMVQLGFLAHQAFLRTVPSESRTGYGLAAYSRSRLATNPAHAATFQRVTAAARALATTETVRALAQRQGWNESSREGLFISGLHLLENAMATPGLVTSRTLLQFAGLAPTVGYANDVLLPLSLVWRERGLANAEELTEVDMVRALVELASRPSTGDEDRLVTAACVHTQARWDAFVRAEREHNRAVPHDP